MAKVFCSKFARALLFKGDHHGCVRFSRCIHPHHHSEAFEIPREPFHPELGREPKLTSAEEAVELIKTGDRVYIHGGAATPLTLVDAMVKHGKKASLKNVEVVHIHTEGPGDYMKPDCEGIFRSNSMFIGGNARQAVAEGRGDFIPIFLSEIPMLFRRQVLPLDVALVHVSMPDKHGFCSMGVSVDATRSATQNAKYIIGQLNPHMPRTLGDGLIHVSHFHYVVEVNTPLFNKKPLKISPEQHIIGKTIADNLVDNGATLQLGIGEIPDATLSCLLEHKDLGIHSEMFSDGILPLIANGAVTNSKKRIHTGKAVGSFAVGSQKLYDFMNDNPTLLMMDVAHVNNTTVISQNPRVTAINSCIEVDLTGQVVSDSIGTKMFSGVGGQIDFIRGASLGYDGLGKPILALQSTTKRGESKITPFIKTGGGVVTTRAHVHYIVTEYGIAYLFGKNLRQRAHALINIAHPDVRETLEKAAFERLNCMPSP
ncbi:4-hydroxybutyrate coenzyme A transferase-like [Asterias rubens]|uniref:4-hydroxybutyrate coenzyme A transferase-like n=1 Tax=Asterias rubens TaxID=7604 RepID=UPI001455B340|nr:4-hydroxybutyrate coenzyme A transferase-like [Asterias rubens]